MAENSTIATATTSPAMHAEQANPSPPLQIMNTTIAATSSPTAAAAAASAATTTTSSKSVAPLNFRPPSTTSAPARTLSSNTTTTITTSSSTSPPSLSSPSSPPHPTITPFIPSTAQWMSGPWHVTHSTLPMWKSNRNVVIHYTLHPSLPNTFDNLVEYSPLTSSKRKTVAGVEKADPKMPAAWNWRGKGWLVVASSHWEVLGWGDDEDGWMVTFFDKTLFTPAGIDVLCRRREGVSAELMGRIRAEIERVEDNAFAKLAGEMFEVKRD